MHNINKLHYIIAFKLYLLTILLVYFLISTPPDKIHSEDSHLLLFTLCQVLTPLTAIS